MEKLKELRASLDLSQTKFADMVGVTQQAMSQYENGKASPSIRTLKRMAKILGVEIVDLIDLEEDDDKATAIIDKYKLSPSNITVKEINELSKEKQKLIENIVRSLKDI